MYSNCPTESDYENVNPTQCSTRAQNREHNSIQLCGLNQSLVEKTAGTHLCSTVDEILKGFNLGLKPRLTDDGTSGTYVLRGEDRSELAVFKPIDEE